MLSSHIPVAVSPIFSLTTSHCRSEKPLSSFKLYSTAGKITGDIQRLECFSRAPTSSSIPKSRLANAEIDVNSGRSARRATTRADAQTRRSHHGWKRKVDRKIPIQQGHKAGSINLKRIISMCRKFGVKVFTVFAFSTDNWKRSKIEVDFLMKCIEDFIKTEVKELIEREGVRFSSIGKRSMLPESLQTTISAFEESSKTNNGMQLVSALSYGGQCDIIEATKKIATKVEDEILRAKDVDQGVFEQHLMTNILDFPNPDLLLRTSGELRVSNFLLWQLANTELYFSDKVFPDFGEDDLIQAFTSFQRTRDSGL